MNLQKCGVVLGVGVCCLVFLGFGRGQEAADVQEFNEQRAQVLDMIYSNPEFLPLIDVKKARVTLEDLARSFERMTNEYRMFSEQKDRIDSKYNNVQDTIERILSERTKTEAMITDTLTKITLFKKSVATQEKKSEQIKWDMDETKSHLQEYSEFLYRVYNEYYEGENMISDLKLLVKSENITDTLSTDTLVEMLMNNLHEMLGNMQRLQVGYVKSIMDLNKAKRAYTEAAKALNSDLEKLNEQQENLYKLLTYLKSDRDTAESRVSGMLESRQALEDEIGKMRQLAEGGERIQAVEGSVVYDLMQMKDRDVDAANYFTWPVLPIGYVQYVFNDDAYLQRYQTYFDGIRLQTPHGTPVRAMAPGIVYKVHNNNDISLSWITIVHKNGYTSFYSPMSTISVSEGDLVRRGQVIGHSGGEPGTNGAGISAEGPRLDLRIRKNGEPIDPFEVLDLSVFMDEEEVPEGYRMKHVKDTFSREVSVNFFIKVDGESVEERRDAFLRRYGRGVYTEPSLWIDASDGTGIDPVLGICIGFAETSFRNFASENNVGNVYNNDRGDRVAFATPLDGVRAIYHVLNNKYLGEYNTLSELSRFGNRDGFIYASSSFNRQKNIMSCLSAIYGFPIPEDFTYRVE